MTLNNRHTTMPQRIGLLLRMEWGTQGRNTLYALLALLLALIGIAEIYHQLNSPLSGSYTAITHGPTLFGITFLSTMFYTFGVVQKRINHSDTLTYTTLPALAYEKFLVILIEGLLAMLAAIIVNQVAYSLEILLHPYILETYIDNEQLRYEWISPILKNSSWDEAFVLFNGIGIGIFYAISIQKKVMSIVGFLLTLAAEAILTGTILNHLNRIPENMGDIVSIIYAFIGLGFLIYAFINLKKRQLK